MCMVKKLEIVTKSHFVQERPPYAATRFCLKLLPFGRYAPEMAPFVHSNQPCSRPNAMSSSSKPGHMRIIIRVLSSVAPKAFT